MSGSNPFRRNQQAAGLPPLNASNAYQSSISTKPESTSLAGTSSRAEPHSGPPDDEETVAAGRRFPSLTIQAPPLVTRISTKPKTVRIASPPASTPISPQSYPSTSEPSSPIFARQIQQFGSLQSGLAAPNPEKSSDEEDPFSGTSDREEDPAREQVLLNTQKNTALTSTGANKNESNNTDAVQRTLARFSARPQRTTQAVAAAPVDPELTQSKGKQAMDVDAFKRLLLTGNASGSVPQASVNLPNNPAIPGLLSESSSNTDTASLSRHSIPSADTPRTSHDNSSEEIEHEIRPVVSQDDRKRPPPPRSHHGKLIKSEPSTESPLQGAIPPQSGLLSPGRNDMDYDKPLPTPPSQGIPTDPMNTEAGPRIVSTPKRPPIPPLTRRKSQREPDKNFQGSETSIKRAPPRSTTESSMHNSPLVSPSISKVPPAPPTRRGARSNSNASSINQAIVPGSNFTPNHESESSSIEMVASPSPQQSDTALSRTFSASSSKSVKRMNRPMTVGGMPPPPPPPRRGRESSRGSMDSQRPSAQFMADVASPGSSRRSSGDSSRNVSGSSHGNDILADLAALQREVDALRQKQRRES